MSMVKVDGAKIKRLREEQGLTQLYLATAVQVTTDTISRWENRRYPSIKKENGIKLAEALNVALEDILEEEVATDSGERLPDEPSPALPGRAENKSTFKKIWPLLLLALTLFGIIVLFSDTLGSRPSPSLSPPKESSPDTVLPVNRFRSLSRPVAIPSNLML